MLRRKKKIMRNPAPCGNGSITCFFFTCSASSTPSFTTTTPLFIIKQKLFVVEYVVPLIRCCICRRPHLRILCCRRSSLFGLLQILFIIAKFHFPPPLRLPRLLELLLLFLLILLIAISPGPRRRRNTPRPQTRRQKWRNS